MSTRVAIGSLGLACVMAAGGGAYLASRQNADVAGMPTAVAGSPQPEVAAAKPAPTVAETEAVIDEAAKPGTAVPAEALEASTTGHPERGREAIAPVEAPRSASRTSRPVNAPARRAPAPAARNTPAPDSIATGSANAEPGRPVPAAAPEPDPAPRPAEPSPAPVEPASPPPMREPVKTSEELVVSADSVIGLQIENTLTSERARVEDRVEARVTRDVTVGDRVAIPAGSRMLGSVTQVERGGKVRERARLGVRFHTLVLADGSRVPVTTDTLFREGAAPARESAAKIGGAAVGGAILGAILGGGKGAAAGAAAGAAGGTAAVMAGDRNAATLSAGSNVTVRVLSPVTITVEK